MNRIEISNSEFGCASELFRLREDGKTRGTEPEVRCGWNVSKEFVCVEKRRTRFGRKRGNVLDGKTSVGGIREDEHENGGHVGPRVRRRRINLSGTDFVDCGTLETFEA